MRFVSCGHQAGVGRRGGVREGVEGEVVWTSTSAAAANVVVVVVVVVVEVVVGGREWIEEW